MGDIFNQNFFESIYFGLILTIISYQIGLKIYKKTKNPILHPLLISIIICISTILIYNKYYNETLINSFNNYNIGSNLISIFLGPVTVMLALPMYRQIKIIKKHFIPLLTGVLTSVLMNFFIAYLLIGIFEIEKSLALSVYPKNITTPMAINLSEMLTGDIYTTTVLVVITGIMGAIISPIIFKKLTYVKSPISKGIAIGANSHAVGTAKAFELGEIEGALSSVAIGLTGIITVFLIPLLLRIFN